jgi:ankyrin repeat protein
MATRSVTYDHVAFLRRVEAALADGTDPATAVAGFLGDDVVDMAWQVLEHDLPRLLSALIQHLGLDVNGVIAKCGGWSLLGVAASYGAVRCVAALIALGADVDATFLHKGHEISPMLVAAQRGSMPLVRQLVDAGASFSSHYFPEQISALHVAASRGHIGVAALLLQRGADTLATDKDLRHPISHAVIHSHLLCVKALLPKADLAHADAHGLTLLHQAVLPHAGPDILEAILPRYVEAGLVDTPTVKMCHPDELAGCTALMFACEQGCEKKVDMLLKAGASRHPPQDSRNPLPLDCCIVGGSLECTKLLLGDAQIRHYTPLELTASQRFHSPLFEAVHDGRADLCELLIAAGADPHGEYQPGGTFLDAAHHFWPDNNELAALFTRSDAP